MTARTLRIRYMSKLGLPNYSSVEAEVELTAELDEGEAVETAMTSMWEIVKAGVLNNVRVAKAHLVEQQEQIGGEDAYAKRDSRSSYRS